MSSKSTAPIQKRLNKANKDLEAAIKTNDLQQVVALQRKVTDLEDEIKAVEYMEKKRGNNMGFIESLSNMFRNITTSKEKQAINLQVVKKEIEKLDKEIIDLKKQYGISLDGALLDAIANKQVERGELKAKADIMSEALEEFDKDITLAIDYEAEINTIYAPLHEKEAQYKDALKKAKAIEGELLEVIEQVKSNMSSIISNLKYISDEDRDIVQGTQGKNENKLLFYSSNGEANEVKSGLDEVTFAEQYIPRITHQMYVDFLRAKRQKEKQLIMIERENQDAQLKAMGIEWEAGEPCQ